MRNLFGLLCVCALGVVGCSETADEGCASQYTRVETCDNLPCCEGLWCETQLDGCEGWGECQSAKIHCSGLGPTPVCGCDRNLYATGCDAHQVGFDVGDVCRAELTPTGRFRCGPSYCVPDEYCAFYDNNDYTLRGDPAEKNDYHCVALPEACDGISDQEALCQCIEPGNWGCSSVAGNGVWGVFV